MKKLLSLVLFLLLVFPSFAFSVSADLESSLESLDLDQLYAVNDHIQKLIFQKKSDSVSGAIVPPGEYSVGVDIPAGIYRIEAQNPSMSTVCSFLATNEETVFGFATVLTLSDPVIGKLELTDGTNVSVSGGTVIFSTYTGLF